MKLACALFHYFPHGGLQKDFLRIAQEALKRGHQVTLFCGECEGTLPEEIPVVKLPLSSRSNHGRAAEFEKAFPAAAQGFDLTLGFNRMANLDFYFAGDDCLKRNAERKYPHLFLTLSPRHRTFLRQEEAVLGIESKTKVFTIAEEQKADFVRFYNTPAERLIELPPGIDELYDRTDDLEKLRNECRRKLNVKEDEFLLVQVASVVNVKGIDRTFRAIGSLPETLRNRCKYLLIGAVRPWVCFNQASSVHILPENLRRTGAVSNVREYLAGADLMIHPARKESAGSVLIEALACRVPVICSGVCGFAPYVEKSGGVVLPEPFSQAELDNGLRDTLEHSLEKKKEAVRSFREKCDFFRRSAVVVDALERALKC